MATIDELKQRIDLHDLASYLGLVRPGGKGNYKSPHHDDKSPSLGIMKDGKHWRDYSGGKDDAGSCIDLVCYVKGVDVAEAVLELHKFLGIEPDKPGKTEEKRERSLVEHIAARCLEAPAKAVEYLESRGISRSAIDLAIKRGAVGFNDWVSEKIPEGEHGHGGPAVAFIVKTLNPGHVVAVDLRYLDPALNGNTKTTCQGEKYGYGWTSDIRRLMNAHTIYICESPINALSIDSCEIGGAAAFATRGLNVSAFDWQWLRGKRVRICMDNDKPLPSTLKDNRPNPRAGERPGLMAAWELHEILTAMDISAMLIDQSEWKYDDGEPINDINDFIKPDSNRKVPGLSELRMALYKTEPWIIQGQPGKVEDDFGKQRIYLPYHDNIKYWRFRVKEDFTSFIDEVKKDDQGNESFSYGDLSGFRIASISRVQISSATATMTGDPDSQPHTMFAVSVQTARHGAQLIRRVVEDEKLHNVDTWKRFGPVWNQSQFLRMVNILERAANIGARNAANFVGLCYRDGNLVVNEGPDCYFTNPDQQCPYHNLTFPSGPQQDAATVIAAYQDTFRHNAAMLPLVWALGGHLKVLLGFWPHMQMQAPKGYGKSTLIKRLERTVGFTMFSGQSLQTEFRLLTSVSHTSHPVGWEELSARRQDIIDKAVALLQENYQYTVNRRGSDMTEFLISAPVLLAGEDVPVRSLIGKLVRTDLSGKKGPLMPDDMPRFPVRQWLEFLTDLDRKRVQAKYNELRDYCLKNSIASGADDGATRMASNYAALLTCWRYLCEFAGIDPKQGGFAEDLLAEMNSHIRETSADREPWVWIMETALSEIARHEFKYPYKWDYIEDNEVLLVRTSHIMEHLSHTPALREKWNGLPVKSDRVFKKHLLEAGVILRDTEGKALEQERTIDQARVSHMVPISLEALEHYGLHATPTQAPQDSAYS